MEKKYVTVEKPVFNTEELTPGTVVCVYEDNLRYHGIVIDCFEDCLEFTCVKGRNEDTRESVPIDQVRTGEIFVDIVIPAMGKD